MTNTPEYRVWTDMHTRCSNPRFKNFASYGGRGITVCERWESFENFLADMGKRPSAKHSIDRIDTNGHYESGNCRWATPREQANNKTTTIKVTLGGVTKPLAEWCEERGVKRSSAWLRYKAGLRGEALFQTRWDRITHDGITDTVSGWSKRTGLKPTTIVMRLKREWPVAKALTKGALRCAS